MCLNQLARTQKMSFATDRTTLLLLVEATGATNKQQLQQSLTMWFCLKYLLKFISTLNHKLINASGLIII